MESGHGGGSSLGRIEEKGAPEKNILLDFQGRSNLHPYMQRQGAERDLGRPAGRNG